jgi:hypothetical protein
MGRDSCTALRAKAGLPWLHLMMRSPFSGARVRMFSLWNGHGFQSSDCLINGTVFRSLAETNCVGRQFAASTKKRGRPRVGERVQAYYQVPRKDETLWLAKVSVNPRSTNLPPGTDPKTRLGLPIASRLLRRPERHPRHGWFGSILPIVRCTVRIYLAENQKNLV